MQSVPFGLGRPQAAPSPQRIGARRRLARTVAVCAISAACSTIAASAHAALGRPYASVEADRARFSAKMASHTGAAYTVRTLSLANGGVVREFTNPDGMVFAVAWRGPGRPDLRQLLGDNFETMQADNDHAGVRRIKAPMAVHRAGLMLRSTGHPGAFWGEAYLPEQTPTGFSGADLR